jgi:hypothetical protein
MWDRSDEALTMNFNPQSTIHRITSFWSIPIHLTDDIAARSALERIEFRYMQAVT